MFPDKEQPDKEVPVFGRSCPKTELFHLGLR
jgi:hypothetical protein